MAATCKCYCAVRCRSQSTGVHRAAHGMEYIQELAGYGPVAGLLNLRQGGAP
jgi:hypothetical protein